MTGNAALGGLILATCLVVAARSSRGAKKAKGKPLVAASSGLANGAPSFVIQARPAKPTVKRRAVVGLAKWHVHASHRWPVPVACTWLVVALAIVARLASAGIWRAGVALAVGPLVAAGYAGLLAWRTWHPIDGDVAKWDRLANDELGADGKVVAKAVLPRSRVVGRPVRETDGQDVTRVGLRVRGYGPGQTLAEFRKHRGAIAAAYLVPESCVTVDDAGHNGEAMVWIVPAEWMARLEAQRAERMATVWPLGAQVMDRTDGLCEVAVRMDDGRPAHWKAFTPGVGAWHGVLAGDSRYGKSTFAQTLAGVMCRAGMAAPAFIDLAGGVTFAPWQGHSIGFADDIESAVALLQALDREFEDRIRQMRARGLTVAPIGEPGWPLIPVFVDEGPELKGSPEASRLLSKALRQWAKAGMSVIFASQNLTIESYLGKEAGSISKAQMMAHNLAIFYSNQGQAGLPFSIAGLPKLKGVCMLAMADSDDEPALVRGLLGPGVPSGLMIPAHSWPTEPTLSQPDLQPAGPVRLVTPLAGPRHPDPEARIREALAAGPMTTAELIEATALKQSQVYALVKKMQGVVKDINYGGRWSLVKGQ